MTIKMATNNVNMLNRELSMTTTKIKRKNMKTKRTLIITIIVSRNIRD